MKFALTKFEQLAATSHLLGLPCPNPEYGRKRLRAWDELGVTDLADLIAAAATVGGDPPKASDWNDRTTWVLIDLNADVVDHVVAGLRGPLAGVWADTLTRLRERLGKLQDKTYELPQEHRGLVSVGG